MKLTPGHLSGLGRAVGLLFSLADILLIPERDYEPAEYCRLQLRPADFSNEWTGMKVTQSTDNQWMADLMLVDEIGPSLPIQVRTGTRTPHM